MYDVLRNRSVLPGARMVPGRQMRRDQGFRMKKTTFAVFGLVFAGLVAVAVSSVVAQAPQGEGKGATQQERRRPRVMMLDGRGVQIGVTVEDVAEGVRIEDVDQDSPAAKAGLRSGDLVVEVDGERVRSSRQFSRLIQESPEGRSVRLGVMRDGKRQQLDVTPESRGAGYGFDGFDANLFSREMERSLREIEPRLRELEPRLRELEPRFRDFQFDAPFDFGAIPRMTSPRARLGVQLNSLTPELAEYFGAKDGGVLVARVTTDSPAAKAGLRAGDVITSVDGDRVRSTSDLVDELRDKDGEITLGIVRDKKETSVKATITETQPRPGFKRPA
jgi:serine protease Do